jgi:hypothetical protein
MSLRSERTRPGLGIIERATPRKEIGYEGNKNSAFILFHYHPFVYFCFLGTRYRAAFG